MNIYDWAVRLGVPHQALDELIAMPLPQSDAHGQSEGAVQQDIRLYASQIGASLWRNNNGAAVDSTGRHIRYGLGNDSKRINDHFKSSDLIGITPMMVTPQHVGRMLGVFTAVEVKQGAWRWTGSPREQAQWKYLQLVASKGGIATFATSKEDYRRCLAEG